MAHRIQDQRRHNHLARQANIGDLFGGDDDDKPTTKARATTTAAAVPPTVPVPTTAKPAEPADKGPTAGPQIPVVTPKPAAATTPTPAVVPIPATTSTPAAPPLTTAAAIPTTSAAVVSSSLAKPSSSSSAISSKVSSIASSRVASTSASAASASSSSAATGASSNIGSIVGGVAAGLAVIIAIVFAITYFLRKKRAAQYEKDAFDAGLIDDDTVAKGYNADPSHMAEYNGPTPVTYGNMGRSTDNGGFGSQGGMSSGWNDMAPPPVAFPGQLPFVNGPGSAPFGAPMHNSVSETGAPYDPAYNQGQVARQSAQTFSSAASLGRQPSAAAMAAYPGGAPSADVYHANHPGIDNNGSPRNSDYVDLSRSSVSPFQEAQYKIISNELNSPMPTGSAAEAQMAPPPMPSGLMVSPFDDPTLVAQERIPSTPPMLPEIHVQQRMSHVDDHTDLTQQFPVTPSPMGLDAFSDHQQQRIAANTTVDHSHFSATPVKPNSENVPAAPGTRSSAGSGNSVRPNTVYDPEDAYGGM